MSDPGLEKAFSISPKITGKLTVELQDDIIVIETPEELESNQKYILKNGQVMEPNLHY